MMFQLMLDVPLEDMMVKYIGWMLKAFALTCETELSEVDEIFLHDVG